MRTRIGLLAISVTALAVVAFGDPHPATQPTTHPARYTQAWWDMMDRTIPGYSKMTPDERYQAWQNYRERQRVEEFLKEMETERKAGLKLVTYSVGGHKHVMVSRGKTDQKAAAFVIQKCADRWKGAKITVEILKVEPIPEDINSEEIWIGNIFDRSNHWGFRDTIRAGSAAEAQTWLSNRYSELGADGKPRYEIGQIRIAGGWCSVSTPQIICAHEICAPHVE
ncbi:MAG TPA: hypothetical protein VM008_01720 [Phycisphaerae bacterium]|nr:hypothetical protein [Phycisphaerae bacterium]